VTGEATWCSCSRTRNRLDSNLKAIVIQFKYAANGPARRISASTRCSLPCSRRIGLGKVRQRLGADRPREGSKLTIIFIRESMKSKRA